MTMEPLTQFREHPSRILSDSSFIHVDLSPRVVSERMEKRERSNGEKREKEREK